MHFKRILSTAFATLFIVVASAQQKAGSYETAWDKIDSLVRKAGLTQSALNGVNKLYDRAKKEKNQVQIIKALIYKAQLQRTREEEADMKNIQMVEKEINTASEPARSILQSIAASMYWTYFRANRYKLYDRTETIHFKKEDIATWSTDDFHRKITELFLASISKDKLLQQTKLEPYDPIIIKGNARYLRPTLFDLLAHRALEYFKDGERMVTRPDYAFELDDSLALADAPVFAAHHFSTKDSASLLFHALQLYQQLIRFHLYDARPDALVDADIDRLQFVHFYGIPELKEQPYANALERIGKRYPNLPAADKAWYQLASWYYQKGMEYRPPRDTTDRYALVTAREICERIAAKKDSSEGWANCKNLLSQITRPEVQMAMEKVNLPGQAFRTEISWRNATKLYFRVMKVDKAVLENLNTHNETNNAYWKKLVALPAIRSFSRELPDMRDYRLHLAEIAVDSLPVGQYAMVASVSPDFGAGENPMAVQFFHVSNIAWIQKGQDFFVLNRETGQPLVRANVQVWYRQYSPSRRRYEERKGENVFTDKNGHFALVKPKVRGENNTYQLDISFNNDRLFLNDYLYNYPDYGTPDKKEEKTSFLFTDRSLYRPGQIVYVKGIVISRDVEANKSEVVSGQATTLYLYDVNRQKLDSLQLTTNEFGSYSGKFTLPANLLNGRFAITDQLTNGTTAISVEEYKRPRFSTEIAQPTGTYQLNDTIQVSGSAKAYAGNNINGASVKYRVVRSTILPMWRYVNEKEIWPPHGTQEVEIAHGETTTDANGNFIIRFKAIPDNKIPKTNQPVFYYEISADVTDLAGETRSAATSVSVAYQALQLNMTIPPTLHTDSLKTVELSSTNLAGTYEKSTVHFTVHQLQAPGRLFRERLWAQPDTFTMSREEYYRLFPHDIYSDETDPATWTRGEKVLDITDTTAPDGKFSTHNAKLAPGWYVVEASTKDKYGEEVKALQYVQLYERNIAGPLLEGNIESSQMVFEPGDKLDYRVFTNADSAFVIHETIRNGDKEERNILLLNNSSQSFEIPVTENDRGGIGVSIAFVKNNRLYSEAKNFSIPYSNKDLTISYATYRDKTLPGSKEKWTVKISGYKGAKAAAEVLTAMYDASLDQFKYHGWSPPFVWSLTENAQSWQGNYCFAMVYSQQKYIDYPTVSYDIEYDRLLGDNGILYDIFRRGGKQIYTNGAIRKKANDARADFGLARVVADSAPPAAYELQANAGDENAKLALTATSPAPVPEQQQPQAQVRKNLNETAFFFPDLRTDSAGNVSFSFTMPEAVTQWKWMILAHTKELAFGYDEKKIVTQKDLMVQPNAPRFLREGDRMDFSTTVANITDKEMTGQVELQLIDPETGTSVDGWFQNMFPNQYFTAEAGQSVAVNFTIEIPFRYNHPVTYRVIARSGAISDGEEATLPVVSNRILVTESMPLPLRNQTTQSFKFEKLLKSGESETLNHHALTVEFTSNPAWYAVQSLPYLTDYPYECSEQLFNRYYANALASKIANASPRTKEIFEQWKTLDTAALLSNLQKNEELKSVLLQETPWVLEAKTESEQKKKIALLFDMVRMNSELESALKKLKDRQSPNGGFAWFKGGPDDQFITQYILTGLGHLKKLDALPKNSPLLNDLLRAALSYADQRLQDDYDQLLRSNKGKEPEKGGIGYFEIQYLYMRSFFAEQQHPASILKAYAYYRKQAQLHWVTQNRFMQGMIALAMQRTGAATTAKNIMASLKENALVSEEMGMYWAQPSGYFWYQAPIETQALMIEAFTEITGNTKAVNDLKTWLLKQKQTQHWRTTKATADACYALLLQGADWFTETPEVTIQLGGYTVRSKDQQQEAGTGYFKKTIDGKAVNPEMGNVQVSIQSQNAQTAGRPAWGAVYWQYFEEMDKISSAATPLKLTKKLFIERNTDRGPVLEPLNEGDVLKVGDKVKVRIELRSDRAMEYVHMKDMRAACMEPVNVLSGYKWQGGLGYYESTKDVSTNFFFNWLPKGTFVFEYPLFVTHTGTFSNGITTIQCMYAPEFTSHSEGIKVRVE